jgi:hypothetical protein
MSPEPIVKEPTAEEDRIRPLPLLGVAVGSLVVGFLLVYALGQSAAEAPGQHRAASPRAPATPEAPPRPAAIEPGPAAAAPPPAAPPTAAAPGTPSSPATPPTETPQVPTPPAQGAASARGSTVGEAFYFRCWEAGQSEPAPEGTCDRLPELERRIAAQLPELEACASGTAGTLSLGIEVQLRAKLATYWAGRRSTITPVEPVIACARTRLADTNLEGLEGRFRKYTLFLPIELR